MKVPKKQWTLKVGDVVLQLWVQPPHIDCVWAYGGLEYHHCVRPDWADEQPNYMHCEHTGGPCWHGGSSLAAESLCEALMLHGLDSPVVEQEAQAVLAEAAQHVARLALTAVGR